MKIQYKRDKLGRFIKGSPNWNTGRKQTKQKKIKRGLYKSGKEHPNWKGGKIKADRGYIRVYCPSHPYAVKQKNYSRGYVLEHRLVMEKHIGRYLKPKEVVHHINNITSDNRIENLKLFKNNSQHTLGAPVWNKGLTKKTSPIVALYTKHRLETLKKKYILEENL